MRAQTEERAWEAAKEVGTAAAVAYQNDRGENVAWSFVEVVEVQDLCEETIEHGTEVWSRLSPNRP